MYGPWTTIYGIAFFIIYFIGEKIKKLNLKKWQEILLFFISNILILSILELLAGELILHLFGTRYWDYKEFTWDIDGFICLEVSLFWGFGALFLYYFLYPKVKTFLKKIPKWLTITLVILYVLDGLLMIKKKLSSLSFYNI